jgi:signal transduction histidine kinase
MVGQPVTLLFPEHLKAEGARILGEITRGRRIESYETVRLRKDGTPIDVSVTISPIRSDDGSVVGASTIARDITDRKRAEKRLEEADRQKDQFLAMLGHELRNPLAAVRNATELLKLKHEADPTTTRIREILDRQTRHMAHLMDGLLDVSRIIRNKIDLKFEPVDFGRVVQEVVDDYAARPQRHALQLRLELERERAWVRGDSVRLTQVVDNLIGNAVKFTPAGGSIFLSLSERFDQVIFSVRDTGTGIAPELLPHVFDVFRQAQQSLDRTSGGLGLGLSLVKLLTELHAGSVEAKSEGHDRGAEFIVRIPAIETPVRGRAARLDPGAPSFDILVVEDNRDAATLLCELLEVAGHATDLAISAEAAWELLQRRTPEVVLCDLGLPGDMTGFDLARRIRAEARFSPMRIIALSGYGRPEDKIASHQAGFDAHLTKPVDFDSLQSILTQKAS